MHPVCFTIGKLTIHWYGVGMALAFLAGFANWVRLGKRDGRNAQFCSDLLFWVMIAGILGGRIAYVASDWYHYAAEPWRIFFIWEGGLIYYGGFVGAVLAIAAFARRRRLPFLNVLDLAIVPLPLSHAIGRLGCFMNGCCFGGVCETGPAVRFPAYSMPWYRQVGLNLIDRATPETLPVHPVQFYEAAVNIAVYLLLLVIYRRHARSGTITAVYLMTYPLGRFVFEFLRGTERIYWFGLPVAQVISLGLITTGAVVLAIVRQSSRHIDHAPASHA